MRSIRRQWCFPRIFFLLVIHGQRCFGEDEWAEKSELRGCLWISWEITRFALLRRRWWWRLFLKASMVFRNLPFCSSVKVQKPHSNVLVCGMSLLRKKTFFLIFNWHFSQIKKLANNVKALNFLLSTSSASPWNHKKLFPPPTKPLLLLVILCFSNAFHATCLHGNQNKSLFSSSTARKHG